MNPWGRMASQLQATDHAIEERVALSHQAGKRLVEGHPRTIRLPGERGREVAQKRGLSGARVAQNHPAAGNPRVGGAIEGEHVAQAERTVEPRRSGLQGSRAKGLGTKLQLDVDPVEKLHLGLTLEVGGQPLVIGGDLAKPEGEETTVGALLAQSFKLFAQRRERRDPVRLILLEILLQGLDDPKGSSDRFLISSCPDQCGRGGAGPRGLAVELLWGQPKPGGDGDPRQSLGEKRSQPIDQPGPQRRGKPRLRRCGDLDPGWERGQVPPIRLPEKAAHKRLKTATELLLAGFPEVHRLDLSEERRQRGLDQVDEMEVPLPPVPPGGEEALPLVGDPWRGEGLRGDDQNELLGPVEARLELPDPGTAAREINVVEEHLSRVAGGGEARLQIAVEDLHPGLIAVGVAQEGLLPIGHEKES